MMPLSSFNQGLLDFLAASPTPFHAVANALEMLTEAGFHPLEEADSWSIVPGGRYLVTRNGSALAAFTVGSRPLPETGFRMAGAHTDSPGLRVKPRPRIVRHGAVQLGVEVYGGALLNPWFDRDLSMAGRVTCRTGGGEIVSRLIDYNPTVR